MHLVGPRPASDQHGPGGTFAALSLLITRIALIPSANDEQARNQKDKDDLLA